MRKGFLGCVTVLLAFAGLALGQAPAPVSDAPAPGAAEEAGPAIPEPVPSAEEAPAEKQITEHRPDRFWFRADYLLWWIKDSHTPPLVTTGSPTDPLPGALGQPGTAILFGGNLNYEERSGARFTGGLWFDDAQQFGLEAGYFFLGVRSAQFTATSAGLAGSPVLARPFFDVLTGGEDASLVALPGVAAGTVSVSAPSYLQGFETNLLASLWQASHGRVTLLAGFRYLDLHEDLDIGESDQILPGSPVFPGDTIAVGDHFDTRNNFYGGQAGLRASFQRDAWELEGVAKVALGATHEVVTISGATSILPPGGPAQNFPAGLLALPSNSGTFSRNVFAVVPEGELNLGYHVTRWLRAYVGYTFLYCSDVVRPGDQIDRTINRQQVPTSLLAGPLTGPARPAFSFVGTGFWAQGVNLGLELRF
jgi:hypothetical protein